ncbi:MAG: helix-turn-helix domain-containing protein [Acidimicrobiales bacterium]
MGRSAPLLSVSDAQRTELEHIRSSTGIPTRSVRHAHALLLAAEGLSNVDIASRFGVAPRTVATWRSQFAEDGLDTVRRARRGRVLPGRLPDELAARTFRRAVGRGERYVRVVGLYLNPAQRAVAVSVGRAARSTAHGLGQDSRCHGYQDFLLFAKRLDLGVVEPQPIHLMLDQLSPQVDHFTVDRWLSNPRRERFQLHLVSPPSSWLDLVDRWLRPVTEQLELRNGDQTPTALADGLRQATGQWVVA